jgi:hypothetical protein
LAIVWDFNQDLTRIAEYHPRVNKVDLISGQTRRQAGVAYRCHLRDGKNTCVEKDLEVVPMERIVTALPHDTMGLTKLLPDYVVETRFSPLDADTTEMTFSHYYSTNSLMAKLLNPIIKRKLANESGHTLRAIKQAVEDSRR